MNSTTNEKVVAYKTDQMSYWVGGRGISPKSNFFLKIYCIYTQCKCI